MQKTRTPAAKLMGTGFVVNNGNTVLTNAHVFNTILDRQGLEKWVVFIGSGERSQIREVKDKLLVKESDLALLTITGPPLPALTLGNSDVVKEGQNYLFTGFPIGAVLGLYPVTHNAMISAITPIVIPVDQSQQLNPKIIKMLRAPFNVFQLDGTAYPGNSGSPLYDPATGLVMGIINMVFVKEGRENILAKPSGIAFAIPINQVKDVLQNSADD